MDIREREPAGPLIRRLRESKDDIDVLGIELLETDTENAGYDPYNNPGAASERD